MGDDDLAKKVASASKGKIDTKQAKSLLEALAGESTEEKPLKKPEKNACRVLDASGHKLVSGKEYMLRGEKVKIKREQYCAKSILETYFLIYHCDPENEVEIKKCSKETVAAQYPNGIFAAPIYKSEFEPID